MLQRVLESVVGFLGAIRYIGVKTLCALKRDNFQGFERKLIQGGCEEICPARVVILESSFRELYDGESSFGGLPSIFITTRFSYCELKWQLACKGYDWFFQCDGVFINGTEST